MSNDNAAALAKLNKLVTAVFLLKPGEFRPDLRWEELPTWDSLSAVSLAVGVQEVFGYHMTPAEAMEIRGVSDIIALLRKKNIDVG